MTADVTTALYGIIFTLLATAAFLLILYLFRRIFPEIYQAIQGWSETRARALAFPKVASIAPEWIAQLLVGLARGFRVLLTVLLLYLYVAVVLSFDPRRRALATELLAYVTTPLANIAEAILAYLPNLLYITLIVAAVYYVLMMIKLVFRGVEVGQIRIKGFYPEWADPTYKVIRFIAAAFLLIAVWDFLPGSDSPVFAGVAAFLGLLISLGAASSVASAVAGLVITYMRPFRLGDRVRIADTFGDVVEKTLLVTRVRTDKNEHITIPNSMVLSSHIINYSAEGEHGLVLHADIALSYHHPWPLVHEALIAAALATEHILEEPRPYVRHKELSEFHVCYQINAYTAQPNRMYRIYSELHRNIVDKCNEAGIELTTPHYSALREGNQTTIPESYLPQSYTPPAFRVRPAETDRQEDEDARPEERG